jgi:hypothetical protein
MRKAHKKRKHIKCPYCRKEVKIENGLLVKHGDCEQMTNRDAQQHWQIMKELFGRHV